jgi:hypothetical protein
MSALELRLIITLQHLVVTARMKAYDKEDHTRIVELLNRVDHLCNLALEGIDVKMLYRILVDTSGTFPEYSRSLFTGPALDLGKLALSF